MVNGTFWAEVPPWLLRRLWIVLLWTVGPPLRGPYWCVTFQVAMLPVLLVVPVMM